MFNATHIFTRFITVHFTLAILACAFAPAESPSPTLASIRASGLLRCGIDIEQAEYSTTDDNGNREAFDADLCYAVAVAALGKDAQVKTMRFPDDRTAMNALNSGEIDIAATLPADFSHSVGTHLQFTRPVLWDGVGFLVLASTPPTRAHHLSGKKICFLAETAVEDSLRAWFARQHLEFVPFPFQEEGEMQAAFATGNCGALAGDRTRLAETRIVLAQHGKPARLLPETISKDPLAAAVHEGDSQWAAIVNWVMEALIQAEESGVTQANVQSKRSHSASDPALRFLFGESHEIGPALGLADDWVVHMIAATGNYGEIYQRDLGSASPLKLPRGENNLRLHGGLITALPFK